MPAEPIYTDSSLLKNRTTTGCPNRTDISGTNVYGVPLVYDPSLSLVKVCTRDMFKPDHNLANTQGCCVVDSNGEDCTDYTTEKETEEPFYDMGVAYFKTSESNKGQRKICYTTPIRKRRVKYMELLYEVFYKCCFLILIALQASCYEYWMIYGKCDIDNTIATTLTKIPYQINEYPDNKSFEISTSSTCDKSAKTNMKTIDWYSTFPYNLITFINEPNKKEYSFDPRELLKIPVRGFLLGFFYCIIISRILMKAILSVLSDKYFSLVENRNNNTFLKGVIFVLFFMGLYGNIAYLAGVTSLPGLNATTLLFLLVFGFITIWIGGFVGMLFTLFSFLGYRKDLRNKHKLHLEDSSKPELTYWEKFVYYSNSLFLTNWLFRFKRTIVPSDEETKTKIDLDKIDTIDEKVLDWFYPIRLDELKVKLPYFLNIDVKKHLDATRNNWFEVPPECEDSKSSYFFRWLSNSWDGKTYELYNGPWGPWGGGDGTIYKPKDVEETEKKARIKKNMALLSMFSAFSGSDETAEELDKALHPKNPCGTLIAALIAVLSAGWFRLACLIIYWGVIGFWYCYCFMLKLAWFFIVFYWVFTVITCGFFGNMIAFFYLHLYVIIGFFYAPISDYKKLFEIIKSHGNILTLLFCAIVLQTGVQVLDPISSGVIGGLLAILVAYKLIGALNV